MWAVLATPRQEVLGYIRKIGKQVTRNKSISHVPPWPLYKFLP